MKTLLAAVLVVSLATNGILAGFMLWRPAVPAPGEPRADSAPRAGLVPAQPGEIAPVPPSATGPLVRAPKDPALADPRVLAERMRRDGYPEELIQVAALGAFQERNRGEHVRLEALARQNWSAGSAEAKAAFDALEIEYTALANEISRSLPGEAERAARLRERQQYLAYGSLSPGKVAMLQAIETGYNAVTRVGWVSYRANPAVPLDPQLVDEGRAAQGWAGIQAVVRKHLTAEEAEDYFRYNATLNGAPAGVVQDLTRAFALEQAAYDALVDRASALALEVPPAELRRALLPTIREALGDERFLTIAPQVELQVAGIIDFVKARGALPSVQAEVFLLGQDGVQRLRGWSGPEARAFAASRRAEILEKANLTAAHHVAAFDQTYVGRVLLAAARPPAE